MRKMGIIVAILLLFFIELVIAADIELRPLVTDFVDIAADIELKSLQALCKKNFAENYICGIGEWTSNSPDTALQIATWFAKGEITRRITYKNQFNIETTENFVQSRDIISDEDIISEITGIRKGIRRFNSTENETKKFKICDIPNIKGKVSLEKIREERYEKGISGSKNGNLYAYYYILINGKIAGSCSYSNSYNAHESSSYESYLIKIGEGVPDIKIQKILIKYDQESKIYTAFVLVTLPKALVSK